MKNQILISLFIVFLFANCNTELRAKKGLLKPTTLAQRHEWAKELALCSCLRYGYNKVDTVEGDVSRGILIDIGDYWDKAAAIDSSAKAAAARIEPAQLADYGGRKAIMLGCFNYYMSKQLDSLVKTFDKPFKKKR